MTSIAARAKSAGRTRRSFGDRRSRGTLPRRSGLRIIGRRGDAEVAAALIRFARWLRANYEFPIRVPVYLHSTPTITTFDGRVVSASFFAPFHRNVEPYIRIATGDYRELKKERGRDNALASYLVSLGHEVAHYRQWLATGGTWERGVVREAVGMLRAYETTVDRP